MYQVFHLKGGVVLVIHYRVDERVIHGQTQTRITKETHCDGVLVVDDQIAADPFMMQVYKGTLPSMKVLCFTVETALKKLPEAEDSQKNYIVIFKKPETAAQMIQAGYRFKGTLNIGPQAVRPDSTYIMQMLGLTEGEMQALDEIEATGAKIILNPTFTTPNYTWQEAKEALKNK